MKTRRITLTIRPLKFIFRSILYLDLDLDLYTTNYFVVLLGRVSV